MAENPEQHEAGEEVAGAGNEAGVIKPPPATEATTRYEATRDDVLSALKASITGRKLMEKRFVQARGVSAAARCSCGAAHRERKIIIIVRRRQAARHYIQKNF